MNQATNPSPQTPPPEVPKQRIPRVLILGAGIFLFILFLLATGLSYSYSLYRRITVEPTVPKTPTPVADTRNWFEKEAPYSVLVMGYGGGGHEGGRLTDTMMLVQIVPKTQNIFLISIPRDLWVPLETREGQFSNWKINAAYAIGADDRGYPNKPAKYTGPAGGGVMAMDIVKQVTGIEPDHFVTLDFAGFGKVIDVLGGVDVKVERSFEDPAYPLEEKINDTCGLPDDQVAATATMSAIEQAKVLPCRYEVLSFSRGITHMDGTLALKYVRSRHSAQDGGDFNRSQRQKNVILAAKDKVVRLDFFTKIIPFTSTLADHLTTDLHLPEMELFLKYKDDFLSYEVHNLAITSDNALMFGKSANGQSILMPKSGNQNWSAIQEYIKTAEASASGEATGSAK